jgi:hypothetical protein
MGDMIALELLRNFGNEFHCPQDEITQACNLASGPSDIVIILQRPNNTHNYAAGFQKFVDDCRTLQAVDRLIRLATNGSRSIHTVTILDAFSYKPPGNNEIPDERCHKLLAHILMVKKPKVLIRCHKDEYQNAWMKQIELPAIDYKLQKKVVRIDDHSMVVMQSFHPSIAVNNADYRPEYKVLLMYHFISAFAHLCGTFELPECVKEIQKLCVDKR